MPHRDRVPLSWHDATLRSGYFSALLLGSALSVLSLLGLFRHPHWIWAAPIAAAILAITVNHRLKTTETRGTAILLGVATLACLVGAGLLTALAIRIAG